MNMLAKTALAAVAGLTVLLTAGCATGGSAAAPRGSVQACIAFGVRAIDDHRTVTQVPAACRGLSRADVNLALGRAIYLVAGSGHHKVIWRRDAALAGARLARLITGLAQSGGSAAPRSTAGPGAQPGPVDRRPLGLATLAAWLLTVGIGGYMLGRFVADGGLRRQRAAGERTGPAVVLSHAGLASAGLLVWASYLATSWLWLAWVAVALLLTVIGFGMATLIVWSSGTSRSASGTSGPSAPSDVPSDVPSGTSGTSRVPSQTSGEPSGTSHVTSGASRAPSGTSGPASGTSGVPGGTSGVPGGASGVPGGASPAGAPGQVRVAEVPDPAPPGQTAPVPAPAAAASRRSRWLTVFIPIGHGLLAMTTILLALLTALGAT
jgi:hypothetical protein